MQFVGISGILDMWNNFYNPDFHETVAKRTYYSWRYYAIAFVFSRQVHHNSIQFPVVMGSLSCHVTILAMKYAVLCSWLLVSAKEAVQFRPEMSVFVHTN